VRTKPKPKASMKVNSPKPFEFEKAGQKPRTSSSPLKEVLQVVNADYDVGPEWKAARDNLRDVLVSVIAYCDRIELVLTAGLRTDSDGNLIPIEDPRERLLLAFREGQMGPLAPGLAGALKPLTDKSFEVKFWVGRTEDLEARFVQRFQKLRSSKLPVPVTADLFYRLGGLRIVTETDPAQLYLDFAYGISQLDDLRRIRNCEWCGKFHVRKKVERKDHYFCVDSPDCRKAFSNQRRKEKEILGGSIGSRKTKE